MRLIHQFQDQKQAEIFSLFLKREGIENFIEQSFNRDWSSSDYGSLQYAVWVIEEDELQTALRWLETFKANPGDSRFTKARPQLPPAASEAAMRLKTRRPATPNILSPSKGPLTLTLLFCCILLFILENALTPSPGSLPKTIPSTAAYTSPVSKTLFYDYPKAYEIIDQIISRYGLSSLNKLHRLPPQGIDLLEEFNRTPFWQGFYEKVVHYLRGKDPFWLREPMFEKIKQGELWRLFSPCLLHSDLFHLFFNMIWLLVLGKQMEQRLGKGRFLFLIVVFGIFSNTAQYLMSGANFIGFSGVLCGMIMFIRTRQMHAVWEGYQLQNATFTFVALFVLAMFFLSFLSFILEVSGKEPLTVGIANTAHLSGALAGYLLAKMRTFSL